MFVKTIFHVFLISVVLVACKQPVHNSPRNLFNKVDLLHDTGTCHFVNIVEKNMVDTRGVIRVYCELSCPDGTMNGYWLRSRDTLYFSNDHALIPMLLFSIEPGDSIRPDPVGLITMDQYYIKADSVYTYRNDTIYEIVHGYIPFMPDESKWDKEKGLVYIPDEARNNFIRYKISLRKGVLEMKKMKSKSKPRNLSYE